MKRTFTLGAGLFLILCFSFSGISKKRKIIKGPPGTIWLRDTVFMDVTEVRNIDYREFLYWLRRKYQNDEPYIITKELPDTLVWRTYGSYNDELSGTYFSSSTFSNYPVVGISYSQALDFCKWRTERVKEFLKNAGGKKQKTGMPDNISDLYYRLPTVAEWEYGAYAGLDSILHPFGYEFLDDSTRLNIVNVKRGEEYNPLGQSGYMPWSCGSSDKNQFGFYDMIGNVAEMTSENGTCKGGSWNHFLEVSRIFYNLPYTTPSSWLGFRCVCVVKYKDGFNPINGARSK